jgi:hypothetical protein
MANTGRVIVLTLKEEHSSNGEDTGNTKVNTVSDSNYISPYLDITKCPITYTFTCPTIMATGLASSIIFEFSLPNSTIFNPDISVVKVKAMLSGSMVSYVDFPLPNPDDNYFGGTITGLTGSVTYTLEIDYLNGSSVVTGNCPSLGNITTL